MNSSEILTLISEYNNSIKKTRVFHLQLPFVKLPLFDVNKREHKNTLTEKVRAVHTGSPKRI